MEMSEGGIQGAQQQNIRRLRWSSGNEATRWRTLIATLALTRDQLLRRGWSRWWTLLRSCAWFTGGLLFTLASFYAAWQDRQGSAWLWYWYWLGVPWVALAAGYLLAWILYLLQPRAVQDALSPRQAEALALRKAAALGDEQLAPLSPWQPAILPATSTGELPITLGELYRPDALIAFWVSDALTPTALLITGGVPLLSNTTYLWQTWVAGSVFVALGLVGGVRLALQLRPFRVAVSERGLSWQQGRRRYFIGWGNVRSLSVIETPAWGIEGHPRRIYLLDGGDAILTWLPSRQGWHLSKYHEADPSWLLCRLVVTRTGLPLRDLTRAAARWTAWGPARRRAADQSSPDDGSVSERARSRRLLGFALLTLWGLLVATLVLAGIVVIVFHPAGPPSLPPLPLFG